MCKLAYMCVFVYMFVCLRTRLRARGIEYVCLMIFHLVVNGLDYNIYSKTRWMNMFNALPLFLKYPQIINYFLFAEYHGGECVDQKFPQLWQNGKIQIVTTEYLNLDVFSLLWHHKCIHMIA